MVFKKRKGKDLFKASSKKMEGPYYPEHYVTMYRCARVFHSKEQTGRGNTITDVFRLVSSLPGAPLLPLFLVQMEIKLDFANTCILTRLKGEAGAMPEEVWRSHF